MDFSKLNNAQINSLLMTASKKLGIPPEELKKKLQSGDIPGKNSSEINKAMKDKDALSKILNSPQAKELLKKIMNGSGPNG